MENMNTMESAVKAAMIVSVDETMAMEAINLMESPTWDEYCMDEIDRQIDKFFDAIEDVSAEHSAESIRHAERRKKTLRKSFQRQRHDQRLYNDTSLKNIQKDMKDRCHEKNAGRYKKNSISDKRRHKNAYARSRRNHMRVKKVEREVRQYLMEDSSTDWNEIEMCSYISSPISCRLRENL